MGVAETSLQRRIKAAVGFVTQGSTKNNKGKAGYGGKVENSAHGVDEFVGFQTNTGSTPTLTLAVRSPMIKGKYLRLGKNMGGAFGSKPSLGDALSDVAQYLVDKSRLREEWTTQELLRAIVAFAVERAPVANAATATSP
jgi:hypothetical protein